MICAEILHYVQNDTFLPFVRIIVSSVELVSAAGGGTPPPYVPANKMCGSTVVPGPASSHSVSVGQGCAPAVQ